MAALASAFCWAISAILFRQLGDHMSAMAMNLFKGLIAVLLMAIAVTFSGFAMPDWQTFTLLALSGLVGVFLGDTLYFLTLVRLGPRITLILGTLIPVTAALFAVLLFQERISANAWLGVALVLAGVSYVLWEKAPAEHERHQWRSGIIFGLLFVLANVAGILLTKIGVEQLSAMEASLIRHSWAIIALFSWGLATSALSHWSLPLKNRRLLGLLVLAAIIGAFLGSWLSVLALKNTHAAVAVILNSTSPLFILPLTALILKEKVSSGSIIGAMVAVSGIAVYFWSL